MAVTKTFNTAVPYISAGKVVEWQLGSTYVNGVSGTPQYYVTEFSITLTANNGDFTPKKESSWTRAQLEALLPTSQWDLVFASQVESVITNPPERPIPDNNYVIPDES
tara:strand:+ start:726 stop:1049 length:324 start_codon:yes stop_codon:yes gene_type:complete